MSGIAQRGVAGIDPALGPDEGPWEGTAWGQMAFGDILQQEERSELSSAR